MSSQAAAAATSLGDELPFLMNSPSVPDPVSAAAMFFGDDMLYCNGVPYCFWSCSH